MEPIILNLNKKLTLTGPITVNGKELTEVTVEKLIKRPVMKRIIFIVTELTKVIVYDGETEFEAHKDDSEADLTAKLLQKIAADYSA